MPNLQRQLGYFIPIAFNGPKSVFPGLFPRKLTEKSSQRVFGPVFRKFERENLENNTLNSSNFDFIVLKSQIFVELCTASGNTEKTFQQTYQVGNRTFCLAKLRKYQKIYRFLLRKPQIWPIRPILVRAKHWVFSPELLEQPKNPFPELDSTKYYCQDVF